MRFGGRLKRCLFRRRGFQTAFGWFDLERLAVCDGLGGKPGGNDAFEQGVAGEAVGSVQAGAGCFA